MASRGPINSVITPSKKLLNRIDVGLTTAICAVFISFLALLVAKVEIDHAAEANKETIEANKVMVMPIIDIDLGYLAKKDAKGNPKQYFEVTLSNVGAGIAHIQRVQTTQHGKAFSTYKEFEDAVMTGRMRSWASLTEKPASGFLPAGNQVSPVSLRLGAAESDLPAYLRGKWGEPMDGVDVNVCYCSMYKSDCWSVNFLDRKLPKKVDSCGIDDQIQDAFQDFADQRANARKNK